MVGSGDAGQKKDLSELPRPFSNSWAPASSSPHCPGTNHCIGTGVVSRQSNLCCGTNPSPARSTRQGVRNSASAGSANSSLRRNLVWGPPCLGFGSVNVPGCWPQARMSGSTQVLAGTWGRAAPGLGGWCRHTPRLKREPPPRPKPWVGNRCPAQHIPHGGGSHKAIILLFPSVMLMAPDPLQMKMSGKRKRDRGTGASILDAPTPLLFSQSMPPDRRGRRLALAGAGRP